MSKCDTCEKIGDCKIKEAFQAFERLGDTNCYDYKYKSKDVPRLTNFDQITSSVESLAEFFATYGISCTHLGNKCGRGITCKECIKEWLQKECE